MESALLELSSLTHPVPDSTSCYLREIQNKQSLSSSSSQSPTISINTRYVSNVSIGFKLRSATPSTNSRYSPYLAPKQHRVRTRSENNDVHDGQESTVSIVRSVLNDSVKDIEEVQVQLKRAKSLENINALGCDDSVLTVLNQVFKMPEMESVSDRIEKLRVGE